MTTRRIVSALAVLMLSVMACFQVQAQDFMSQPLPIDPNVKIGKLENGLTYFIRKNEYPKDRADFYIAQKVGSMNELENQRGLAHFLEHMCFNGTKNFPDKGLINYLETIGVKFGVNLNAYTAFDKTVYTLMDVPCTRQGVIDSCLMILHDWSGFVTLDGEEIDKERGVIHEEWRSGRGAQMRMFEEILPRIYPNNIYGERLPIGTMDVVLNFTHKELRDYYHKWYRPDLQAIIVVGDIDPAKIESDIKRIFSDIPAHENPAERVYVKVEDNEEPIIAMAYDKEATSTDVMIAYKYDVPSMEEKGTVAGLLQNYLESIVNNIVSERFKEILNKPNAPFVDAGGYMGQYMVSMTKGAFTFSATAREGELDRATKALVAEIQRIRKYGFNAGEYDRARTNVLKFYENVFNEKDKQKNGSYANEYAQYFTEGGYIPGIEMEKMLIEQLAPNIPLEVINQYVMEEAITDKNLVLMVMAPKKDGLTYPTEAQFLANYKEYLKQPVEPLKEEVSNQKLMEKAPKAGKITKQVEDKKMGVTQLTLSNGINVYIKQTDFKNNQILFRMVKPGGKNRFNAPADLQNVKFFGAVSSLGGVGQFDNIALGKALTGRSLSSNVSVGNTTSYVSGRSTKEDLETLFQLMYLQLTSNRKDTEAFQAFIEKQTEELKNLAANPMISFQDSLIQALYPNSPLHARPSVADLSKINYDRVLTMYNEIFANMQGSSLFLVGNVDMAAIKPLLETYVASLPTKKKADQKLEERETPIRKTAYTSDFKKDLEDPSATVLIVNTGTMPYNLHSQLTMEVLTAVLNQLYQETVREDEGGTYGVGVFGSVSEVPLGETAMQIYYQTGPNKVDHLNKIIFAGLDQLIKEGPNKEFFDKTIENLKKQHEEDIKENKYWSGVMEEYYCDKRDFHTDYLKTVESITPADVQKFAKELVAQNGLIKVIIRSTKNPEEK